MARQEAHIIGQLCWGWQPFQAQGFLGKIRGVRRTSCMYGWMRLKSLKQAGRQHIGEKGCCTCRIRKPPSSFESFDLHYFGSGEMMKLQPIFAANGSRSN